jgi:short-subunit dehydrogenase
MELAYVYARNGYDLILTARRKERLEKIRNDIKKQYAVSVTIIESDLSETDSAENLYKKTAGNRVDVLINNAGVGVYGDFKNIDTEKEEKMLVLNILTLTKLTRLFAKDMIKFGDGNIVNIASTAAFQAVPRMASYAASKAYVLNFSEAIANELKKFNIKVTAICPGATKSEFADTAKMNKKIFKDAPTAKELAEYTYKAMKKGKVTAIHGIKNSIMTFGLRLSPRKLNTTIAARIME